MTTLRIASFFILLGIIPTSCQKSSTEDNENNTSSTKSYVSRILSDNKPFLVLDYIGDNKILKIRLEDSPNIRDKTFQWIGDTAVTFGGDGVGDGNLSPWGPSGKCELNVDGTVKKRYFRNEYHYSNGFLQQITSPTDTSTFEYTDNNLSRMHMVSHHYAGPFEATYEFEYDLNLHFNLNYIYDYVNQNEYPYNGS